MTEQKPDTYLKQLADEADMAGTYLSGVSGTTAVDKTSMATAREALVGLRRKFGWMDSMDYDHELGDAPSTEIHATEEGCRKAHKCIELSEAKPQDSYNCAAKRVVVLDAAEFEAALTSGAGSESAGLREGLAGLEHWTLDDWKSALEEILDYVEGPHNQGNAQGRVLVNRIKGMLYALAPAISRPPTQGSSLPPSRAELGGDRHSEREFGRLLGRLEQFDRMKKERPITPWYWDMHERSEIEEALAALKMPDALAEGQQSSKLVEKSPSASPGERE